MITEGYDQKNVIDEESIRLETYHALDAIFGLTAMRYLLGFSCTKSKILQTFDTYSHDDEETRQEVLISLKLTVAYVAAIWFSEEWGQEVNEALDDLANKTALPVNIRTVIE